MPLKRDSFKEHKTWNFLITFGLCMLILLPTMYPLSWGGWNEPHYFGMAKHRVIPTPYSPLYAAYNHSFGRIIPDYFIGYFIKYFGLDLAWQILRVFAMTILAASYAYFTNRLDVKMLPSLISLLLFLSFRQAYFAGEWIFGGVEPKIFSYVFVLTAISLVLTGKMRIATLCLVVATYSHFLVGFFWAGALFLYAWFVSETRQLVVRNLFCFMWLVVPILFLLIYENHQLPVPDLSGIPYTLNQIYSDIRSPHHVAPFKDQFFNKVWFMPGIFFAAINLLVLFILYRIKQIENRRFILFTAFLHVYLFGAIVFAYFDRHTQYFGKFYLFRPASLILLITLVLYTNIVYKTIARFKSLNLGILLITVVYILISVKEVIPEIIKTIETPFFHSLDENDQALITWVKQNTKQGDIILFEEEGGSLSPVNFEQLVDRPTLVNWMFVPTTNYEIAKWYRLNLKKKAAFLGNCDTLKTLPALYYVAYTKEAQQMISQCIPLIYSNSKYGLFQNRSLP